MYVLMYSNNIDQEFMFRKIRNRIPTIVALDGVLLPSQPLFLLGDNSIHSCYGVQQGYTLGPLGFILTLYSLIVRRLNVKLENILTYVLVGETEVPPGVFGYKKGVAGQIQ